MATDGGPLSGAMATNVVCIIECPLIVGERFPCAQCLGVRSYGTHNDLKKHLRHHHPEVRMIFRCRQCYDFFASPKHVNHHLPSCAMANAAIPVPSVSPQPPAGFSPESIARGLAFVRQLVEQEQNMVESPVQYRLSPRSLDGSPMRVIPERGNDEDEFPSLDASLDLSEAPELLTTPTTSRTTSSAPRRASLWSWMGETNVFPPVTPSPSSVVLPVDSRPPQWMAELHLAHGYMLGLTNPSPLAGMAQQTVEAGPTPADDTATTEAGPNPARDVGPSPRNPDTSEARPNRANDLTPLTEARSNRADDVRCPPSSIHLPSHHFSGAPLHLSDADVEHRPSAIPRPVVNNGRPRRHVSFAAGSFQSANNTSSSSRQSRAAAVSCYTTSRPAGSATQGQPAAGDVISANVTALPRSFVAVTSNNNNSSRTAAARRNAHSSRSYVSSTRHRDTGHCSDNNRCRDSTANVFSRVFHNSNRRDAGVSNNNSSPTSAAGSSNADSSVPGSRRRVAHRPVTLASVSDATRASSCNNNSSIRNRGADGMLMSFEGCLSLDGAINNSNSVAGSSNNHSSLQAGSRHRVAHRPITDSSANDAISVDSSNNNNSNRGAVNEMPSGQCLSLDGDAGAINNNNTRNSPLSFPSTAETQRLQAHARDQQPPSSHGIQSAESIAVDESLLPAPSCAGILNNRPISPRDVHHTAADACLHDDIRNGTNSSRQRRPPRTPTTRRQTNASSSSASSRRRNNDQPQPLTGRAAHFRDVTLRQLNRRQQQQQPRGMAVTGNRAADYFNQQVVDGQPLSPRSPPREAPLPGPLPSPPAAGEDDDAGNAEQLRLTADQRRWMNELEAMAVDDLDGITRVAEEITTAAAVRVETREARGRARGNNDARHRAPPSRSNRRRPAAAHPLFDPADASKIQKLYRLDRKKAMTGILSGDNPYCDVTADDLHQHLANNFAGGDHQWSHPPPSVPDLAAPATEEEIDYLTRPFTADEVANRLSRMANTAPGPDGARYSGLRRIDPGCHTMAQLFTNCHVLGKIPASWKESVTVMAYKGAGDRGDMGNWRPLSLGNTIAKLYSGCIADRLTRWGEDNGRISSEQKGFTSHDGCVEHNFIVQSAIDQARRTGEGLCIAFLDIANAFGVIPHSHIIGTLETIGLPQQLLTVIDDLYTGNTTRGMSSEGLTEPVPIVAGVKQGCPLSPVIFNYSMEPIIKAISSTKATTGFRVGGQLLAVLAYADDLVLLARSEWALQQQLDTAVEVANWCQLQFKPPKCGTLSIEKKKVCDSTFTIQETELVALKDGEHYRHLGVPTGFRCRQTPEETLERLAIDFNLLDRSLLAPWQKIDAAATFLIPRLDFILRGANVRVQPLNALDKQVKRIVKGWLNLPQRASPELVYLAPSRGGAGILPFRSTRYIMSVVHGYRLLTCPDVLVRRVAWSALTGTVTRKIGRPASNDDLADYLNGRTDGDFGKESGDFSTVWQRVRQSTVQLRKQTNICWWWCATRKELQLLVPRLNAQPNLARVHPAARHHLCRLLKDAIREAFRLKLVAKPDQGKVLDVTSRWSDSNHFIRTGVCTRFADWRFIHRARLDCVPLNATRRFGDGPKTCRRCPHPLETLPHVLSCCLKHSHARQLRHHNIVHRVANAVPRIAGVVRADRQVPESDSPLRPDIVVIDRAALTMTIVDVAVVFENRYEPFVEARRQKIHKYSAIADQFRMRGWTVKLDAIIVGALGGWDPANEFALRTLRISKRYCKMMRRYIISDTIRWSRDIYVEHLSGTRQYDALDPPIVAARPLDPVPDVNAPATADEIATATIIQTPEAPIQVASVELEPTVPLDPATELGNLTASPQPAIELANTSTSASVLVRPMTTDAQLEASLLAEVLDDLSMPVDVLVNSPNRVELFTELENFIGPSSVNPDVVTQQDIDNVMSLEGDLDALIALTEANADRLRRPLAAAPTAVPVPIVDAEPPNYWIIDDAG